MAQPLPNLSFDCVDEIPMHRVRGNQLGILLSIIAASATGQLWILVLPLAVQLISRFYGIRYNLFVRLLSPLFPVSAKTESRELLRFNNLLAILFLLITLAASAAQIRIAAYITLAMLTAAVVLALGGFCIGCFAYFQYKQFLARRKASS
ncbi:DUF4395 domain-containing protein [Paenibacillus sp. R14(2021)]|uniref:DUF4395 domain-containing protein n=1 Tax=Paenibacillus sp. R14(2021) TaxID=2859228 RepID=UPI001C6115CD|nr:DUF4395 domain-containing protein [Paenibacillus sp. R14(2021)]